MRLSLSEIKSRAIAFANEWKDVTDEDAEGKSFMDAFFNVFGASRKRVASFEKLVKKIDGRDGYIDLLWKGNLIIEQKSPSHILICDFQKFRLYDLENDKRYDFTLSELHKKINLFDFITGFQKREYKEEDPVNIKAAGLLG